MSGNLRPAKSGAEKVRKGKPSKTDRRILRTRDRLGDALIALIREKNFDDITVQDVLDRAAVGRSTFYSHYSGKEDLFLSDVEDFLENVSTVLRRQGANPKRLLPVQEFFAHLREARELYAIFVKSGKMQDFRTLGHGLFARSIAERLQAAGIHMDPMQRSAHAHAIAGSFFALLDWWVEKGMKTDPGEMDHFFHRLAWRGVASERRTSPPRPQPRK